MVSSIDWASVKLTADSTRCLLAHAEGEPGREGRDEAARLERRRR